MESMESLNKLKFPPSVSPPPPPPPPAPSFSKAKKKSSNPSGQTVSLTSILSPSVLTRQKNQLSKGDVRNTEIKRKDFVTNTETGQSIRIQASYVYLNTQNETSRLTALHLGGLEQLTDMLFYVLYSKNVKMKNLTSLNLTGCVNLTDQGIKWITKICNKINEFSACGCKKLTDVSLFHVTHAWMEQLYSVSMMGTSISMLDLEGYSEEVKLNGCPLISPTEKNYKDKAVRAADVLKASNIPWNSYKMVIFPDDKLPWSPLALITQDKDVKATKKLTIKTGVNIDSHEVNIFQVPLDMGFGRVLLSPGCIVVLPYLLAQDGPDQDYADAIVQNMISIYTMCPECQFVLLGLCSEPSLDGIAERYRTVILNKFNAKIREIKDMLKATVNDDLGTYKIMKTHRQKMTTNCVRLVENAEVPPSTSLLLSDVLQVESDVKNPVQQMIKKAVKSVRGRFPAYFLSYQKELQGAIDLIQGTRLPLSHLEDVHESVQAHVKETFVQTGCSVSHMDRIFNVMKRMGKAFNVSVLDRVLVSNDFAQLEALYEALFCGKAPSRASWRHLGSGIPCWTQSDLEGLLPNKEMLLPLVQLLEEQGLAIKMYHDRWTKEIPDRYAFIMYKDLPFLPSLDVDEIWPDTVPVDEMQAERYVHFKPGVHSSYFPLLAQQCLKLGGVVVMWKRGIIIRKGPVSLLLEMLSDRNDHPVLFIGARLHNFKDIKSEIDFSEAQFPENRCLRALFLLLQMYELMSRVLIFQQKLYAEISIPCPQCLPSKNRYKVVNSSQKEVWTFNKQLIRSNIMLNRPLVCGNDGTASHIYELFGPPDHTSTFVPSHNYLGCLPAFSAFNRCLFCHNCALEGPMCPGNLTNGRTSWNCSCDQEGQMCDKCGMCQRCTTLLARMTGTMYPRVVTEGCFYSLSPNQTVIHEIPLTPNYSPVVEVHLVRGMAMSLNLKFGQTVYRYSTNGTISELFNNTVQSQLEDAAWMCKEGFTFSAELKFSEEDPDSMSVIFRQRGGVMHTFTCQSQACEISVTSLVNPMCVIITLPDAMRMSTSVDEFGEKSSCTVGGVLHSKLEAMMLQSKQYIESILFQAGGVNYSGSTYLQLPRNITVDLLQYPSFRDVKTTELLMHLLCYTRSKIADVLSFSSTQAVPESWSVYRKIHLIDSPGIQLIDDGLEKLEKYSAILMLAWNFVYKLLPNVHLPKSYTSLLPEEVCENVELEKIEVGLHDLIDMNFWRLFTPLKEDMILALFNNTPELIRQAQFLQEVTNEYVNKTGMHVVQSIYNEETLLYLCAGHNASVNMEKGLTTVLPDVYGNYSHFLLSLDLPANKLTRIPEEVFCALPNLAEFDCSNNFIEVFPSSIGSCKNLHSLSLSENNLSDLPDTLAECKKIWRIDITSNMFEKIPSVVTKLKSLQRLYASNMFMTELPEDIGNLVELEKLYVNGNCFSSLPKSFAKLRSLNDLGLAGVPWLHIAKSKNVMSYENFLAKLGVWRLDRWLEEHQEEKQALFALFDEDANGVLDTTEMGRLNAALFNMFPRLGYKGKEPPEDDTPSGFPPEILGCTNLEYLNMYYQGFVSIPPEIGNLQELRIINVSHNPNLLTLPAEIGTISSLTRLEMENCPLLKTPPKEIRAKGFSTTFAYLRRLMSGSVPCKRTKLMLVGLGGAGKTSLVNSLLSKDGKADLTHGEAITDGIDISTWSVKAGDESITFSVWDFAGQTVYYNTHQFFLSNRAVYLLAWNVRLGYEHAGLDFWLSSISVQAPKAPIFVVGTHVDQVSKFEVPMNEMRARYKQIAGFHCVSSYTGQGIKALQDDLFDVTLQQQYMGEQIPEVWLTFENNVISARGSNNVIEYSQLEKMASVSGIFEKTEVYQAVQFLHELGSLQHFTTELLKSKVVISPQWIVDVMACIVSVKNSPIQDGRLYHKDIETVWRDYPAELHNWLLKLTEEYDLTFPLENQPVNLVPCLLPEKQPEDLIWTELEKDSEIKENKMIYKFDYLPAGLFNRGQVRLHQISDSAKIWKKGSFLNKNGHVALLQQSKDSELLVTVQGPRPENVIFLVHEVFEGLITESFGGIKYDFLIPCPDCLRTHVKDPHMFAASTIRRALELKAPFLQCIKQFHTISCVDLLACMPPDNHSDFDLHLVQSVRNLRDLRKDLSADLFFSYCAKNAPKDRTSVIHPATVRDDLQALGFKCWYPESNKSYSIDEMARALNDASVFIAFMSNDYAKDEECVNMFKYARLTLKKPMVVISVGENFDWKHSKLGILLSDEVFVNMIQSKRGVYQSKFEELTSTLASKTNRTIGNSVIPSCFFSYTWVNSARAVALGTKKIPGATGHGDPREIKEHLEKNGVKCWIDVERVGQNGLFDDIAEGLLSAKVVVVCVSDEYASSPTCQIEFRYAANTLKLPIIMAVVGTGSRWRATEVGVLSLSYPVVSFQEKSETAYTTLLSMVKERLASSTKESDKTKKDRQNEEHKNLSFQELYELAQRKLLRQLCFYAEHQDIDVFPRLFVVDFLKPKDGAAEKEDLIKESDSDDSKPAPEDRPVSRMDTMHHGLSKKVSELKSAFRVQKFCVHMLCEHDEGWHSVTEPFTLPHDFGEKMLEKFSPFVARITAVMKYNKHFTFNCQQSELGEDYLTWLEENPQATMSDYQQIYHEFRKLVLDLDTEKQFGNLSRCRLPNGKTIWLCKRHQSSMKVTVLSTEAVSNRESNTVRAGDLNMVAGLREADHTLYMKKFTSSKTAKRKRDPNMEENQPQQDMYSNFELLPDKKVPKPAALTKKSSENKKPADQTKPKEEKQEPEKDKDTKATEDEAEMNKPEYQRNEKVTNMLELEKSTEDKKPEEKKVDDPEKNNEASRRTVSKAMKTPEKQSSSFKEKKGVDDTKAEQKASTSKVDDTPALGMSKSKTFYGGQVSKKSTSKKPTRPSSAQMPAEKPKSKACSIS